MDEGLTGGDVALLKWSRAPQERAVISLIEKGALWVRIGIVNVCYAL